LNVGAAKEISAAAWRRPPDAVQCGAFPKFFPGTRSRFAARQPKSLARLTIPGLRRTTLLRRSASNTRVNALSVLRRARETACSC